MGVTADPKGKEQFRVTASEFSLISVLERGTTGNADIKEGICIDTYVNVMVSPDAKRLGNCGDKSALVTRTV